MPVLALEALKVRPELAPVLASWAYFAWSIPMGRNWEKTLERYDPAAETALPRTYIAFAGDAPVGMASLRDRDSHDFLPGTTPWICNVYVHEAMRSLGVAGLLCRKLVEVAEEMGFPGVFLASSVKQDSLYHRLGFREFAEVDYFGPKYVLNLPISAKRASAVHG